LAIFDKFAGVLCCKLATMGKAKFLKAIKTASYIKEKSYNFRRKL